jgi:hypothetical protein
VFHSLLKAHAVEARAVVKQALEILTPSMPGRMEDGESAYKSAGDGLEIAIKSIANLLAGSKIHYELIMNSFCEVPQSWGRCYDHNFR